MTITPCRECNKIPDSYPPSRIEKYDWICNTCMNIKRAKWAKQKRGPRKYCPNCNQVIREKKNEESSN